ncbi:unnamed protein product [Cyprideis torosa]|uniref:TM7S3/TM198-like domain-containing protein n=1 Tax=Cyprideis torosa TaxID=163714 RepID=A0A7R8ZQA1_9CRUS|nr:unnamed protein product [Cyprideis torosa]CAG0895820.1 unnamed protein product [Cyprideis torosa]
MTSSRIVYFGCFLFFIRVSETESLASTILTVGEGRQVVLKLSDDDSSETPITKQYIQLGARNSTSISVAPATLEGISFVIFQAHSHTLPTTLSLDKVPTAKNSWSGCNIGLVKRVQGSVEPSVYIFNSNNEDLMILIAVIGYPSSVPIPGGCNMEFPVEISPFLNMSANIDLTVVSFQRASSPPSTSGVSSANCVTSGIASAFVAAVEYEMYYRDLPEGDLTEDTYFDILQSSLAVEEIRQSATQVRNFDSHQKPEGFFNSFPGMGMVYYVIVYPKGLPLQAAAYVPITTYACDIELVQATGEHSCNGITTWFGWLLCAFSLFLGLLISVRGHRCFALQAFVMGTLSGAFVSFIIIRALASNASPQVLLPSVSIVSVVIGILWLLIWWYQGIPILTVLLSGLNAGLLLTAFAFSSRLVNFSVFRNDFNFWSSIASGCLLVPILLLGFAKLLSVFACALLGSFGVVVALDRYFGSTLAFTILNIVRRGTVENFDAAIILWPLQITDIVLLSLLALLFVGTFYIQWRSERGRAPFPPPRLPPLPLLPDGPPPSYASVVGTPDREPLLGGRRLQRDDSVQGMLFQAYSATAASSPRPTAVSRSSAASAVPEGLYSASLERGMAHVSIPRPTADNNDKPSAPQGLD